MFNVDDLVVYSTYGVCKVAKIGPIDLPMIDKTKQYYTLAPYYKPEQVVYASVENDSSVMRYVISKEEAMALIKKVPSIPEVEITNEKERESIYKAKVRSCDLEEIISILKTLWVRRKDRIDNGKKITVIDDRYFKQAEDQLIGELSIALGIDRSEVTEMVFKDC